MHQQSMKTKSCGKSNHSRGSEKQQRYDSLDAAVKREPHLYLWDMELLIQQKISYSQMQTQMEQLGYENVFIGTVEGEPEDTSCEAVIEN